MAGTEIDIAGPKVGLYLVNGGAHERGRAPAETADFSCAA